MKKKISKISTIIAGFLFTTSACFASIGGSSISGNSFWKLSGTDIELVSSAWTLVVDTLEATTATIATLSMGFTEGNVAFSDASGNLTEDNDFVYTALTDTLAVSNLGVGVGVSTAGGVAEIREPDGSDTPGVKQILRLSVDTGRAFGFRYSDNSNILFLDKYYSSAWDDVIAFDRANGNVGINTTDLDGTPAIGQLTVKGSTNDGSTNAQVWRDSDEANVASLDTNGNLTATSLIGSLNAGGGTSEIANGTALPATCAVGMLFHDTDSDDCADTGGGDGALCICKSTDTWALISNF